MTLGLWDRLSQRCAPQDTVVVVPGQLMDDRGGTFAHIGLFRGRVYPPANSSAGIGVPVLARQDADKLDAAMDTMGLILRAKRAPLALMDVPGVSHDPLVDEIMKYVGGLRRVLSDPAALLDREPQDRRVPTSGRITRGTLARLSGHSEDWDRLLPEGPQPRRLRVERLEERFDLHENRIFVDALVNLERLVRKRTALVGQATDANQEAKGLADTTYQARSRIANALMEGRGDLDDSLARMAEALMQASQRLRRLRGTISAAKSCEPATSLGWKRFSEPILQTNLFISDPKYADVAAAARLLRNQGDNTSAAREARLQKSKERQEGFDLYTRELLERAIRGVPILESSALCRYSKDGTIEVRWRERSVRIVPVAYPGSSMIPLLKSLPHDLAPTIVLGVGRPAAHTLHHEGRLSIVQLGPFAVFSLERLSAALRWHLEAPEILAYPYTVAVAPELRDALHEILGPGCEAPVQAGRALVRSWSLAPDLTQERLTAAVERRKASGVHGWDSDQIERLLISLDRTWQMRCCPICRQPASPNGWVDEQSSMVFRATCPTNSCGATWRLRKCGDHRVPELVPGQSGDPGGDQWAPLDTCPVCSRSSSG